MPRVTKKDISHEALLRKERLRELIAQSPPPSLRRISEIEGLDMVNARNLIIDLGDDGITYLNLKIRPQIDQIPYGLTSVTSDLRAKLGDQLFLLREKGNHKGPNSLSPRLGLNFQQQKKAVTAPFTHDWTLSQIERLAREVGRDPRELLLSCLTN